MMKIIKIYNYPKIEKKVVEAIKKGGSAILPFDTVYGLVANPFDDDAMDKIYKIKGRDFNKPIALVFSLVKMLKNYISMSSNQEKFISKRTPGAYTFIIPWRTEDKKKFSTGYQKLEKIGIRIPNYRFILDFIKKIDQPIAATSANISGLPNCWNIKSFLAQLNNQAEKPDYVIDAGQLFENAPSEVIDISDLKNISVLRK